MSRHLLVHRTALYFFIFLLCYFRTLYYPPPLALDVNAGAEKSDLLTH